MFGLVLKSFRPGFVLGLSLLTVCTLKAQTNTPPPDTYHEAGCHEHDEPDLLAGEPTPPVTPDWAENPARDVAVQGEPLSSSDIAAAGAIATASGQPVGALTGRLVFTTGGHGWTWGTSTTFTYWRLQRGFTQEMNEDTGNLDQMNMFAAYAFNAGATVAAFRPIGYQTNEAVLDNVSAGVTFQGTWFNSSSTEYYYGSPGDISYRYANLAATETATATYTPNIPKAGFYPIYTWVRHGSDRCDQLYKINHTGGQSLVKVPHYMIGNFWVYLGTYYFNAGSNPASGSVVISNFRQSPTGTVVIADAIRFGNGMGSIDRGGGVSTYPREDENARYWVQAGLGVGMPASLYDFGSHDESDSWHTPPRMSAEMNREQSGNMFKRVHINFHSNAGGGRGAVGLINSGGQTPNQARLAKICGDEVNNDLEALGVPPLEVAWNGTDADGTFSGGYSEISSSNLGTEMDATIIEVAYHDNASDSKIMRDPKGRAAIGKAALHAVIKYMNEFDGLPLNYLPEPPSNARAIATTNGVVVSWSVPIASGGSGAPTGYVVYRSSDGYGFGNPISVAGGATTSVTISDVDPDVDIYFRVAAVNAGGESFPSETIGCRFSSNPGDAKILFVNGYDRFDRTLNLRQTLTAEAWQHPGPSGTIERVMPRLMNSFDYVVQHGKSISTYGLPFDSCSRSALINNQVSLSGYTIVVWEAGQEIVNTINSTLQSKLSTYLDNGGNLFISGSDIATDLGLTTSPAASRTFLQNKLHAILSSNNATNSSTRNFSAAGGSIFAGNAAGSVDDGTKGLYNVQFPDVLTPSGTGASSAISYVGGSGGSAAIQYNGASGGGRVVYLGFPFEAITSAALRDAYMSDALTFLNTSLPPGYPNITAQPQSQTVAKSGTVTFTVTATGAAPLNYQWRKNGINIAGATTTSYTLSNLQTNNAGNYSVVVSNAVGVVTSDNATLTVTVPTVTQIAFLDNFDTNSAPLWQVNKSSADTRATFFYNYGGDGIPSAPNSVGGTTRGLKFEANLSNGVAAALSASPIGKSFTGDFKLRFDMWINANGPFPLGGNGSTEHITAGVGTAGNRVQWTGAGSTADGVWFNVDGEGQAGATGTTSDYNAYIGTTLQSTATGVYAAGTGTSARGASNPYYATKFPGGQTAPASQQAAYPQQTGGLAVGTVGFKWRDVIISKQGNTVEWFIDGLKIATITGASFTANNIFVGYWDAFNSLSDNKALSFGVVDNVRVEVQVEVNPPVFVSQPQSQTIVKGDSVTFTASATGTAPLSFQWRLNGSNISGATATSYTRLNVQPFMSANYSVVVTNIAGAITSTNAFLNVIVPPSITTLPQSQSVPEGTTATFTVAATGTAPFSYQWQFNGSNIAAATASSLSIPNVQASDAGNYSVLITNLAGSTNSPNALLTVTPPPPLITQHPQSQTVYPGTNVTFSVVATGAEPLSYQWSFNGTNIPGATASSYVKLNVQSADAGDYAVVVSNPAGSTPSEDAALTVLTIQPLHFELITVLPDNRVTLQVSGEPDHDYMIEVSTNLTQWTDLTSISITNDMVEFTDDSATNHTSRFYRARNLIVP